MAAAAEAALLTVDERPRTASLRALPVTGGAPQRFLLVSSEPQRLAALAAALSAQPAEVTLTFPGAADRHRVLALRPDVVLLDHVAHDHIQRMLDELRGWRSVSPTPVLALGGSNEQDMAVPAGIDGCIGEPWDVAGVLVRLQGLAHGRRLGAADVIEAGPIVLDVRERSCRVDDRTVDLTFIEFEMLKALTSQPNRFLDPIELLRIVWDGRHPVRMVTLRVWIKRLRDKLPPQYRSVIETRRSVGYRLALGNLPA